MFGPNFKFGAGPRPTPRVRPETVSLRSACKLTLHHRTDFRKHPGHRSAARRRDPHKFLQTHEYKNLTRWTKKIPSNCLTGIPNFRFKAGADYQITDPQHALRVLSRQIGRVSLSAPVIFRRRGHGCNAKGDRYRRRSTRRSTAASGFFRYGPNFRNAAARPPSVSASRSSGQY